MSLLDTASLLLTPNAYKEGKLYSVIPSDGSGDFTFTRATTATRVNSDGLVELVPYNLLQRSEEFENAIWTKVNSSVTANAETAPNGTLTADKMVSISANTGSKRVEQTFSAVSGTTYTVSAYFKADGWNFAYFNAPEAQFTTRDDLFLNLTNGTLSGSTSLGSVESVGNGWYRLKYTRIATASGSTSFRFGFSDTASITSTGDGTNGVLIWGAQVNEGTILPYQKTETRLNIPRLDYSLGGCPNILLEPQRTNLILRSQELDSASVWFPVAATVSANNTTSPDGTVNADKLIATAVSSTHIILQQPSGSVIGTNSTVSIFAKAAELSRIQIVNNAGGLGVANYNLSTGTATLVNGVSASIQDYGNGWYRCIMTYTPTTTGNFNIQIRLADNSGNTTFLGNGTSGVFLWGAQLEAGSYATSYIPTTTASVTRNRDQCVKTGISSLIGQTEGTLFINAFGTKNVQATSKFLMQILGSKNISITFYGGNINVYSQLVDLSVPFTPNQIYKIAVCYSNSGNFRLFVNGVKTHDVNTYASGTYSDLGVGCRTIGDITAETSINSAQLYKTALTDAECIQLTTI